MIPIMRILKARTLLVIGIAAFFIAMVGKTASAQTRTIAMKLKSEEALAPPGGAPYPFMIQREKQKIMSAFRTSPPLSSHVTYRR